MVKTKFKKNTPKKRYLITKGKLPESAGGNRATFKEKILFAFIVIVLIIVVIAMLKFI